MQRIRKIVMGVAALGALAFGGAQIAGATGGSSSADTPEAGDTPDQVITGTAGDQASTAAVDAVGGGTADSVEAADEGGAKAYEVKVTQAGKTTEVTLDKAFNVISQKADDDQGDATDTGDGDGETADDNGASGHQDAGDGDGENPND